MANETRTVVEVQIHAVLGMDQAHDLTKAISNLIDEHVGMVAHTVKATAPFDQTWNEVSFGRMVR